MISRIRMIALWALVIGSSAYCALLWANFVSRSQQLRLLQQEVSNLNHAREENQLITEIVALKAEEKQTPEARQTGWAGIQILQRENQELRQQLDQWKAAPAVVEARRSVDANQLRQIGQFFGAYAKNNGGKFPSSFNELKYYLAADVYPGIETDRFEILVNRPDDNADPNKLPLVRSRISDTQHTRVYLFADGHVENRGAE
jgi:prepilin-type processing-associated H-X9-DG protein